MKKIIVSTLLLIALAASFVSRHSYATISFCYSFGETNPPPPAYTLVEITNGEWCIQPTLWHDYTNVFNWPPEVIITSTNIIYYPPVTVQPEPPPLTNFPHMPEWEPRIDFTNGGIAFERCLTLFATNSPYLWSVGITYNGSNAWYWCPTACNQSPE